MPNDEIPTKRLIVLVEREMNVANAHIRDADDDVGVNQVYHFK